MVPSLNPFLIAHRIFSLCIIFFVISLVASGCSSVQYAYPIDVPAEALENAIQEAQDDLIFETSEKEYIPEEWWLLFKDDQLNQIIQASFSRNPTLQSARMQILSAHFMANNIRSALYPYLGFGADVSRQKLSKTGVIPFDTGPTDSGTPVINVPVTPGKQSGIPEYFTLYETELNFRYNFDFWDKNRNAFRAALGQVQANIAEEAQARLQLGISIAEVYYELQTNYRRREIAKSIVANRQNYLDLVQKRVKANLDNQIAIQVIQSDLIDTQDSLLQIEAQIAVNEHQLLAYMAGNFDEQIQQIDIIQHPLPKIPLPRDLPLHLIAKRPDITAQLWLIESAGRQIEVAKAGFYPDFNLTALFGFQTIHLAKLFEWSSVYYNIDPAVTLPIFDGGKLVANLRSSEVNYASAIVQYNNLVINATKEVLDGLTLVLSGYKRYQEYERKFKEQSELYRLTKLRISHSLDNELNGLVSEENVLISQDQEALALERTIKAILSLIKSIGGGYENCEV